MVDEDVCYANKPHVGGGVHIIRLGEAPTRASFFDLSPHVHHVAQYPKMKLTIASLFLVGSAAAFAPTASVSSRNNALNMATGTATEGAKVRLDKEQQKEQ